MMNTMREATLKSVQEWLDPGGFLEDKQLKEHCISDKFAT